MHLQDLNLGGWRALTDSGLMSLEMCSGLRTLNLWGTDGIKGHGLASLASCHALQVILSM